MLPSSFLPFAFWCIAMFLATTLSSRTQNAKANGQKLLEVHFISKTSKFQS